MIDPRHQGRMGTRLRRSVETLREELRAVRAHIEVQDAAVRAAHHQLVDAAGGHGVTLEVPTAALDFLAEQAAPQIPAPPPMGIRG